MFEIRGTKGMTWEEIQAELKRGGRFVVFEYCISVLVFSAKRSSPVYLIRQGENASREALGNTLLTFVLSWRGIPFGLIYTIQSLPLNANGGRDVIAEVLATLQQLASEPKTKLL